MQDLGDFRANGTVRWMWPTNAGDGSSITRSTDGSIRIYKNNSTTERTSSSGITDTEDFDTVTGVHQVVIDLSDNTDAGFYAAGNDYFVVLVGAVIDGKTVNSPLAKFSIENRNPQVDVSKINGVATTSVTTVNANVGTTQPLNFTGTGSSALVKTDVVDFGGTAGTFSSGRPEVNMTHHGGTAYTAGAIPSAAAGATSGLIINGSNTGDISFAGKWTITPQSILDNALTLNSSSSFGKGLVITSFSGAIQMTATSGTCVSATASSGIGVGIQATSYSLYLGSSGSSSIRADGVIGIHATGSNGQGALLQSNGSSAGVTIKGLTSDGIEIQGDTGNGFADIKLVGSTAPTLRAAILTAGAITSTVIADGAITDAKITAPSEASGRPTGVLGWIRRLFELIPGGNKRTRTATSSTDFNVALRNEGDTGNLITWTQGTSGSTDTETKGT